MGAAIQRNATTFRNFRSMYVDPLRVEIKSDSRGLGGSVGVCRGLGGRMGWTLQYDLLPLDGAETYTLGFEDIFTIFAF